MIITIKGVEIDLAEKEKITFSFESFCNGLNAKKLSRTQSFKIPKTPKNLQIFGFSNRAEVFGAEMRVSFDAVLTYGGGQLKGILYITNVSEEYFNSTFLYGECLELKRLKEAGKLKEIMDTNLSIVLRKGNTSSLSATLGQWVYFNGESDDPDRWRYPAVKISYLLNASMTELGLTYSNAFSNSYLSVLRSQNGATGLISSGSEYVGSSWNGIYNANYFYQDYIKINDYGTTFNQYVLICAQACKIRMSGLNNIYGSGYMTTSGLFVIRGVDYNDENDVNEFYSKRIKEATTRSIYLYVDLEPGDCIFYGTFKDVGAWGVEIVPPLTTSTFQCDILGNGTKLALSQDSIGYQMGTFQLKENLPDLTALDLINLIADLKGGIAYFDDVNNRFDIFTWNFDAKGGDVIDVDSNLIKVESVERKAFEYGQRQIFSLKKEDRYYNSQALDYMQKIYTVPNELIVEETETNLKGTGTGIFTSSRHGNALVASIATEEYNDTYSTSQLKEGDNTIVAQLAGWSSYGLTSYGLIAPVEVTRNNYLQNICTLSTKVKVDILCDDIEWQKISKSFTRFTFRGGWYFCTNATFTKPKATLTLQRYK